MIDRTPILLWTALVLAAPAVGASGGEGDTPPPEPPPEAASEMRVFDETVVTARAIEEPVREVPFSLTVFESAELQQLDVLETADLFRAVPNFNYTDSGLPEANLLNIRGVGSSSTFLTSSVVYYLDGVPAPPRAFDLEFLDVERIEILRGPQGTLFGQGAQAGAVHIVTRKPTPERRFDVGAGLGSFGAARGEATANGRLGTRVTGRVSVRARERDGDIDNFTFAGPDTPSVDEVVRERSTFSLAGRLHIDAGPRTTVDVAGRLLNDRRRPTTGLLTDSPLGSRQALDPLPENDLDTRSLSVTMTRDGDRLRFTSTTAVEDYELGLRADISDGFIAAAGTGAPPFVFGQPNNIRRITEDSTQLSQEFRAQGAYGDSGASSWVAGLSVLRSDFSSTTDVESFALPSGAYTGDVERTHVGLFAETTFATSGRLRLIGGVRLNWEENELRGTWRGRGPPSLGAFDEADSVDSSFLTGRLGASFDLTDAATGYVTVARGEKAAGFPFFNQGAAFGLAQQPFGESSSWSYEAGVKGGDGDGRSIYALAIFLTDTADEQFFIFNPLLGQFQVDNADSESYGLELDAELRPAEWLRLGASLGLLEAEATADSTRGLVRAGNAVPYAPDLTTSADLRLRLRHRKAPAGPESLWLGLGHRYVGERALDPRLRFVLDDYHLIHLRLTYRRGPIEVFAAAHNVLDEDFVESGFLAGQRPGGAGPVIGGVPGRPFEWELGLRVQF
ncbi:MAG: TonB-dependent receptor [Acidobacteriota bacterium]